MERWQQIESLFQEALERDPAERNAWLREACQGDSDLRREVAALLANHQAATVFKPWAAAVAAKLMDESASLQPGQCLGPYRIERFIAAGGMGAVYRATDTRLYRQVAIKVSAARFTERFEREARVIASLNHPNICQLYDVGPNYLVMEFVEGPTLAERIRKGALPLDEALAIARQTAEALEAAHEKSIVHRDLKPANIKITTEGVVKVLDFGLAKAAEKSVAAGDPSESPTQTISATSAGVILGTAAYMSPEQARGAAVDKRSDIWSLGVVLYEMLTGRHLFRGETVSDTLADVLKTDPDWTALPPETPESIRRLLRRCLERDRKGRLHDAADALIEINEAAAEPAALPVPGAPKTVSRLFPWIVNVLLALALPAIWLLRPMPEERLLQFEVFPPPGHTFGRMPLFLYAISPDGRKLAFAATSSDSKRSLWVRPLNTAQATHLPGTDGAMAPFWDPASRWIAFVSNGKLQKIDLTGGQPQVLCDAPTNLMAATWNRHGVILLTDSGSFLSRVSAEGGVPSPVLALDASRKETLQANPQFLPDGRFLYDSFGQEHTARLGSLDGKSRRLMPLISSPAYYAPSRDGRAYLLFLQRGQLMAQPFNLRRGALDGEPAAIAAPLATGPSFSASENGVLAFRRSRGLDAQLTWFDREGKLQGTAGASGAIYGPRISPDQKSVAFSQAIDFMFSDTWLFDRERGTTTRLDLGADGGYWPVWSPDGRRIVYLTSKIYSEFALAVRSASGTGKETVLYRSASAETFVPESWSRDGRWLLLTTGSHFYVLTMAPEGAGGERKLVPLAMNPSGGRHASFSPDGRWILYASIQTGRREVFVEAIPEVMGGPAASTRQQVSIDGGSEPVWRADGKEIFYLALNGKMMAVPLESRLAGLKLGSPEALFLTNLELDSRARQYDVSMDGKRFLFAQPLQEAASLPITVVVNWPELVKKGTGAP
jgi:Tol biopolymer transport system component/tRNA A-37 threonylcarbamoyl transferase component Bud32